MYRLPVSFWEPNDSHLDECVCGPHRSYYPQTQTYHEENLTINRTVSLEDVRIVGYNRCGRQRTVNLIQDQEEEFANNIRKAIVDNFHRNRLFALTHENDSTSHIISSVEIQDLKLLNKLNTFGKVWVYTALPAYLRIWFMGYNDGGQKREIRLLIQHRQSAAVFQSWILAVGNDPFTFQYGLDRN